MLFKTPHFWNHTTSLRYFLRPISWMYQGGTYLYQKSIQSVHLTVPVVCVGNIVMGGAGKTPIVIELVQILSDLGHRPHILSRGYGAAVKEVVRVNPDIHDYLRVGDEPLLLSQVAPTWVSRNRLLAAKSAIKAGATILVLDDGLQNPSIIKDFNVLVVDSCQGFGNYELFPAGPLREPITTALKKIHLIIVIGDAEWPPHKLQTCYTNKLPPYTRARFAVTGPLSPGSVVAFAGLGYPKKFFDTLTQNGFKVHEFITYADHHPYTILEMKKLIKIATHHNARLITTEKDFLRIPFRFREYVKTLPVRLVFDDLHYLRKILEKKICHDGIKINQNLGTV